ncbi:MAG: SpoIIE family protein phosphatase [Bacteroidetes bacterium]|nr:SpoIIE family protein phosphatase [Bacteroidota bacterium]
MNKIRYTLLFILIFGSFYSQKFDAIYDSLKTIPNDSLKVNFIIRKIVDPLENSNDFKKAETELFNAKKYINGNDNITFKINTKYIELLIAQEKFDEANNKIANLELEAQKLSNPYRLGYCLRLKAQIQLYLGNLSKSTEYYFQALTKFKETKIDAMISLAYSDIAVISYYNENYKQAAEYWEKSIELDEIAGKQNRTANTLSNLGLAYIEYGNLTKAETALQKSLSLAKENNQKSVEASAYTNLTKLEYTKKNYKKAIEYNNLAAQYYKSVKKYNQLSNVYSNGAELARTGKEYKIALDYIDKAFAAMQQTEKTSDLYPLYLNKAAILYDLKDYKPAYDNLLIFINKKDSLVTSENQKNINELEKKYQLTERKKENALLNEQIKTQEINSSRMRITIGLISLIVVILAVTAFLVVKQNRIKNKINSELNEKNNIINLQKNIVEDQHRDITDSIKYAKRIQEAILPPLNLWNKILPSSFILHLPKDVLSGDFYWIEETENYTYVAAADCTGHGVPGALISIVNFNLLNKAVLEKNLVTPSEILDAVNLWLTESLHQTYGESAVRDGMDITLIAIHKHSNEVLFAGANNSIYTVSNGDLKQIKGDKFPVGAFIEDKIQKFSMQRFTVEKGDSIFLFSDGFADQFGGPKGKKYKYLPFQQKLTSITNLNISQQQASMKQEFLDWKGSHEQVDDVLVIGIKIS